MRFIAFNMDGGYTELCKKENGKSEEVCNCQLLCDSEADSVEDFIKELKNTWDSYNVGRTVILRVEEGVMPVYVDV